MKTSRGISTDNVVVRVPSDIKKIAESVARAKGITLSDFIRASLVEAIEDEYDIEAAEKAYKEYLKNPVGIPWEDIEKELDEEDE